MAIVLYRDKFWISPYVFSAFVALREKQLSFDTRIVDLGSKEQRAAPYLDKSITGRVPALEHDGFYLAESSAIVEYVDERFDGTPLLPRDLNERARARQVMAWIRSDLLALREERPTTTMFYERAQSPLSAAGRAAADKLVGAAERLLAGRSQLFSDWSSADADLAFMLQRLVRNEEPVPRALRDFAEAQWQRPSVAAFVNQARGEYESYY